LREQQRERLEARRLADDALRKLTEGRFWEEAGALANTAR
jgi:hypothetical protein